MTIIQPVRLSRPGQLVAAVPALLGFRPVDSMVAVVTRAARVELTARWDLTPADNQAMAARLNDPLGGLLEPGDAIDMIGFGRRRRVEAALARLRRDLDPPPRLELVVSGGRWWFAAEAVAAPGRPVESLDQAGLVWPGASAAPPTRPELVESIRGPVGRREDELMAGFIKGLERVDQVDAEADRLVDLINRYSAGQGLTDDDFLTAVIATASGTGRDRLWSHLTRENAREIEAFWREVLRRTPTGLRAIPLGVTGLVAWVAGDGAMASICLAEAASIDPDHPLIGLLAQIMAAAVGPRWWDVVRADIAADAAATAATGAPGVGPGDAPDDGPDDGPGDAPRPG